MIIFVKKHRYIYELIFVVKSLVPSIQWQGR